ncbi:MAG: GGDEF domain-containing protein [Mariprofundaceae bacterium]|nr:GGDEF domain-containing protein [Mariprofundaceae bacterium]
MPKYQTLQIPSTHGQAIAVQLELPQTITLDMHASDIYKIFAKHEEMVALPVVNHEQKALGLITRRKVMTVFSHTFSHELNRHKRADILLESKPLIFDSDTNLESVSQAVTKRQTFYAFDPVMFTEHGKYMGILSIITLLKIMTEVHVKNALDCNPLSQLPGNNSINHEIDQRLHNKKAFILIYADLDSFKAYNDHYGYERGDHVIQWVASVFKAHMQKGDFVGHVGGDDFVIILKGDTWQAYTDKTLQDFSQGVPNLYKKKDRELGYILGENRQGKTTQFPFISLSLAVIPCPKNAYSSHVCVAEVASEIKHLAKQQVGNSVVVNRRK